MSAVFLVVGEWWRRTGEYEVKRLREVGSDIGLQKSFAFFASLAVHQTEAPPFL